MICVSLAKASLAAYRLSLQEIDFAEIRLDLGPLSDKEIRLLFAMPKRLIATYRPGRNNDSVRLASLSMAIEAGASFVDIEHDARPEYRQRLVGQAHGQRCRVIVSYHNEQETPDIKTLNSIIDQCRAHGAAVVKIACLAQTPADNARLLGLLAIHRDLIVIGMGAYGTITRLAGPLLGAPFTYAAEKTGAEVAPGQMDHVMMARILASLRHD